MTFNLKSTAIFEAVLLEKTPLVKWRRSLKIIFLLLAGLLFIARLVFYLGPIEFFETSLNRLLEGWFVLFFMLGLLFSYIQFFFENKLKKPKLEYTLTDLLQRQDYLNLASFLDLRAAKTLFKVLKRAKKKKLKSAPAFLLLDCLIRAKSREIGFVFNRAGLPLEKLKENLKREILALDKDNSEERTDFKEIVFKGASIALEQDRERIGLGDILIALSEKEKVFQKFLVLNDLKTKDLANLLCWYRRGQDYLTQSREFWTKENLFQRGSLAKDWAAGYTITLDEFALDLRKKIEQTGFRQVVGHQTEVKAVERVLAKKEMNNVLLVGEPGVGRKSIIEKIAQRAFLGESGPAINHKRILELDFNRLDAFAASDEELMALLDRCFSEVVRAGNVILFINQLDKTVKISSILSRYLSLTSFQLIAVTSFKGLHQVLESKPSLVNLFEKVEVSEISEEETLLFLENYVSFFESRHKRFVSYKSLREILKLSSRYLSQIPFPQSALRLLDEAMVYLVGYSQEPVLLPKHIAQVVSEKVEVPLGQVAEAEKVTLLNLEKLIHQRIINQEEAVSEISSALRRARAEVNVRQGPIGSFLFLGPTGVGKTETSKALAAIYFKSQKRMVRLDMSEFQSISDIKRLIGSNEGQPGLLTTAVRENPFCLLLLDEFEKAHPNILNLFLQVLDEGWLTDGFGRRVDFSNALIIATSNAGAEIIREDIRENKKLDIVKEDLLDYLLKRGVFRPELINRFNEVIVFKPLTKKNLLAIAHLLLLQLSQNLEDKGIKFEITKGLKEKIVELSYNPAFGAREMKRTIADKVENLLAEAILSGKLKRGQKIKVGSNFALEILMQ